ncbi:MAG TPA: RNA 2',3'-cyclic phosphodiesterase [Streptosporangiaceae bacterium]|nr:RNA 2',3'-cyclic phosphodiesterase [Streptosporangiaceae bacterium]
MRLFVALVPPPEALSELAAVIAPLRPDWPALRWASPDGWHVTLAFLGQVAEDRLDALSVRLERATSRHRSQEVRIGPGGAFPSSGRARVLWASIDAERQALDGLARLAASVAAGARRAGAPPPDEGRRYQPHLTLARSKHPADVSPLVSALASFRGAQWTAARTYLIRSHTGPQPRYETVASWPLRDAGSQAGRSRSSAAGVDDAGSSRHVSDRASRRPDIPGARPD